MWNRLTYIYRAIDRRGERVIRLICVKGTFEILAGIRRSVCWSVYGAWTGFWLRRVSSKLISTPFPPKIRLNFELSHTQASSLQVIVRTQQEKEAKKSSSACSFFLLTFRVTRANGWCCELTANDYHRKKVYDSYRHSIWKRRVLYKLG